jgi:hypothetical protein
MAINYLQRVQARRNDIGEGIRSGLAAGESLAPLFKSLGDAIGQYKKDKVANELMNAREPTQQQVVQPPPNETDPDPDPYMVTTPGVQHTGGEAELRLRQEFAKSDLENEYRKSEIARNLAQAGGTGGYAKRAIAVKRGLTTGGGKTGVWGGGTGQYGDQGGQEEEAPAFGSEVDPDPKRRAERTRQFVGFDPDYNSVTQDPDNPNSYVVKDRKGNVHSVPKSDFDVAFGQEQASRRAQNLPMLSDPSLTDKTLGTRVNPMPIDHEPTALERGRYPRGFIFRLPDGRLAENQ